MVINLFYKAFEASCCFFMHRCGEKQVVDYWVELLNCLEKNYFLTLLISLQDLLTACRRQRSLMM